MARTFKRLKKDASRRRQTGNVLNWARRLSRLEEALFETNAFLLRSCSREDPSPSEKDFMEAAEEFRAHVSEVLKEVG